MNVSHVLGNYNLFGLGDDAVPDARIFFVQCQRERG